MPVPTVSSRPATALVAAAVVLITTAFTGVPPRPRTRAHPLPPRSSPAGAHGALLATRAPDSLATLHLMPMPAAVRLDSGRLALDASFTASITRFHNARLERGVRRALDRLATRTGLEIARRARTGAIPATLDIQVHGAGQAVQSVTEDESYTLDVSATGIMLRAPTVVGALRGLETVLQLVDSDARGYYLPAVHIADRPRFPWRGLLIDVSRHWEPVTVIERNLDAMAMVKLNVLHWHLSDDQGFRVESLIYPRLQRLGSDSLFYTQAQIREVVAYARDRGIRVVPEFDMPGHATSWFVGYPQFASGPGPYEITRNFGAGTGEFDPTRESVYRFIDRFIGEMSTLFPDAYWHVGGDEVAGKQWDANAAIQRFKRRHHLADNGALQAYFDRRLMAIVRAHHKRMVGWDEIMRPDLPHTVVVQSWRGQQSLDDGAKQGFSGILSAGYYLDQMQSAAAHYAVDPLPAGNDLDSAQAARILGGEACMWGELVTPETIDSRIWPRTAAIAERFWSPRQVTDVRDMYRRLAFVSVELEEVGIEHQVAEGRMLRRIALTDSIAPLRTLLEFVEPVPLGQRMRSRRPTQWTPLTSPGDIARPDRRAGRAVSAMVDSVLRGGGAQHVAYVDSLAREFATWRSLASAVAAVAARRPEARGMDSVATDLARLGAVGAEALSYLAQGAAPPAGWGVAKLATVDSASAPKGLLRISVVSPIRALVLATTGSGATGAAGAAGAGARER